MSFEIEWQGIDEMIRALELYGQRVNQAVKAVGDYIAPLLETYAKENASWQDQTANARQTLHSEAEEIAAGIVDVYLSHGMDYGLYLETRFQGRYAIIYRTLEAHFAIVLKMLQEIFA